MGYKEEIKWLEDNKIKLENEKHEIKERFS